jgi:hypothetical protein
MFALLWLIIAIVLIAIVFKKYKQLSGRVAHLERAVKQLSNRVEPARSPTSPQGVTIDASPDRTKTTVDQAPAPIETRVEAEESLEDLVFPDEPVQHSPMTPTAPPPRQSPAPQPKQSQWADRWQAFLANVDWEQFTGVKLFAWLGGLALFIAAGFFLKFSIDRNLIPPAMRLAIGALTGMALIIASGRFKAHRYMVMRHTLAAGGIGVLYSVVFAATLYYVYLTKPMGFGLLALVSAAAFVLAVYHRSLAISVLGALGAYATPLLMSTGQGSLVMLLAYLSVVNAGLYMVMRKLTSQGLLLVATAGTLATLALATWSVYAATPAVIIAGVWLANLSLFTSFLWRSDVPVDQSQSTRWSGSLLYLGALAMALVLLDKPGWPPLLMATTVQAGVLALAWRNRGWYRAFSIFTPMIFLVALAWMLLRFDPSQFSTSYILLLLYGAFGGLGPMLLAGKYGPNRSVLFWFRIFPVAIVLVSLSVLLKEPKISFYFWPLILGLELIGIAISLLFRAYIQMGLLVLLFLLGGLRWLFQVPVDQLGIGFFLLIMTTGVTLCAAVFVILKKLPQWTQALNIGWVQGPPGKEISPGAPIIPMQQWLAAAPVVGVAVLLAAAFMVPFPLYPHPGMATLICFVTLVLFAVHRLNFVIPGLAVLLAAAAAQAVFVFHPQAGSSVLFAACTWSGALFLAALAAPFLFFKSFERWKGIWQAWAVFEVLQGIFLLYASQKIWVGPLVQWIPLALALLKLPLVVLLLRRLAGDAHRNAILAFHGGVLLFYLSTLPVLVLNHGWIGLTFVFEASALLWLNRRIEHPGLRWVALCMAPAGLLILFVNLPLLKTLQSLPVLNPAVLSVAAAILALAAAASQAAYPRRQLAKLDLPGYFLWLTVVAGFLLVNLIIADLFAGPGTHFKVWPGHHFLQSVCYALSWVGLGGLIWRMGRMPQAIRKAGLGLIATGSMWLILMPLLLPQAAAHMRPLLNVGLIAYLPLLAMLYYLFHKEAWDDNRSVIKNLLLTLFLAAGLLVLKLESSTIFQAGRAFTLFAAHTPAKAAASAAGWLAYGLGMLIWPRRLDRPFRLAGVVLILLGLLKALTLPFRFKVAFAQMAPWLNPPSWVFLFCLAVLVYLTLKAWDQRWPLSQLKPRIFWGVALALTAFGVLNIEIASIFAIKGRAFSMLTHGSLSMQLAYSIGWLLFAIGLLVVGIKWDTVQVRWTAIIAIVFTAFKIFIRDLWSLGQLYRVGSLLGLAVVLILVSFLYQRFLSEDKQNAT